MYSSCGQLHDGEDVVCEHGLYIVYTAGKVRYKWRCFPPNKAAVAQLMSSAVEPVSMPLNQKPGVGVPEWWGSTGCSQDKVLQPVLVGNYKLKLNKNKYNYVNKTSSARTELTVFGADSDVSGED